MASAMDSDLAVIDGGNPSLDYGTPVVRNKANANRIISTPPMADETPTREQNTASKFVFLSDRKSVPTEMRNLQERTIKRRRDFLAQIHEMDRLTAKLLSKYAEERMNLDLATCDTFERSVIHPLITSIERLALSRESSSLDLPVLERRVDEIDTQMTRHIHVTMSDAKIDLLDSVQEDVQRNLMSELRTENNTFNKIEGGIVQRFESVAGTSTRNYFAEGAARRSSIAALEDKIETSESKTFERPKKQLAEIASIRAKLQEERALRQLRDREIMEEIKVQTSALKRAMIAMAGDGVDVSR